MLKLLVEFYVVCRGQFCGDCTYHGSSYCSLFRDATLVETIGGWLRAPECLAAEIRATEPCEAAMDNEFSHA